MNDCFAIVAFIYIIFGCCYDGVSTDRGIILYDNHTTNLSICYGFNSPRYIVKGEVHFDRDAPLKAVGIEVFKDHSSPQSILERHISLDEKHFNDSSAEIYVQLTPDPWKMEFVFNQTLLPEHSNAFIRVFAIFFGAGKLFSKSLQLPAVYSSNELDNITYNVWINDNYVNLLDCDQEIDANTIAILFNITSPSNITCILQVDDGNKVNNITNDVTTVIDVTHLKYKTKQIIRLSFQCCRGKQTIFKCKLHKAVENPSFMSKSTTIIIILVVIITLPAATVAIYCLVKRNSKEKYKICDTADPSTDVSVENLNKENETTFTVTKRRLLLIGKVGTGKSATGNTIVGHKIFATSCKTQHSPCDVNSQSVVHDCTELRVVDGPSIDPEMENPQQLKEFFQSVQASGQIVPAEFDAILLVLRFGDRFKREDERVLEILKRMLGNEVVRDHVILVLTYGDNFLTEDPQYDSILSWCREQEGPFKDLFLECNKRVLLLNNKSKFTGMSELLNFIAEISNCNKKPLVLPYEPDQVLIHSLENTP